MQQDFDRALDDTSRTHGDDPDLLPARLAVAAATVLPVDGASISIAYDRHRVPLGASDDRSAEAERLQFTAGDGPCMTSISTGAAVSASERGLSDRWPELAALWFEHCRFRAAMSAPLAAPGSVNGALNLFFLEPDGNERLDAADVATVANVVARHLAVVLEPDPVAVRNPVTVRRQRLWVAVGLGMERWRMSTADALARLRASAYANDVSLDDLVGAVIDDPGLLDDQP